MKVYENFSIPIIYVSHSSTETFLVGHKINFLNNGRLIFREKEDAFNYFNKEYDENNSDNFLQGKVTKINNNNITTINLKKYNLLVISKN